MNRSSQASSDSGEPFDPLVVPPNEIGWSDESFQLAFTYVMSTVTQAEAEDMKRWLKDNIAKDIFLGAAQSVVYRNTFK